MPNWKCLVWVLALILVFWCYGSALAAPVDQVTVDVGVLLASGASLTLGNNTINFPNADPDATPSIPATQNSVSVRCRITGGLGSNVTLTLRANGNLISGSNNIPISNVTWTATGSGYSSGTMNTTPVSVGNWPNTSGSKTYNGTFSFFLKNSWNYATGNYTASVVYTLTAP
jgi:hypothetical protein